MPNSSQDFLIAVPVSRFFNVLYLIYPILPSSFRLLLSPDVVIVRALERSDSESMSWTMMELVLAAFLTDVRVSNSLLRAHNHTA